jgi:hypothetical protein
MNIMVRLDPRSTEAPPVTYTWDAETDILSAQVTPQRAGDGMTGSVGLEGGDGSWVILDLAQGQIVGVEVAVWPEVHERERLSVPAKVDEAQVSVPARTSQPSVASLEMNTVLVAESVASRDIFHFRLGPQRQTRTVRVARDLLLDVDAEAHIAGLWLLEVPPCPTAS